MREGKKVRNVIVDAKKLRISLKKNKEASSPKDRNYKVYDIFVNGQPTGAWLYAYKGSCHSAVAFCHPGGKSFSTERSLLTVWYPVK